MAPKWHRRRRLRRIAACTSAGLALASISSVGLSAAPPFDTMPDGSWLGSLIYNAQVSFQGDAQAEAYANGMFDFVVAGGLVTEGTFEFSASGLGTADSAAAIAALDLVGTGGVEGTASEPILRSDSVHLSGTASSQGIDVPIDMSFGASELTPIPLDIFTVNCEVVTGSFEQAVAASLAASGGTGSYFGRWVALRADDPESAGTMDAYEQLITDTEVIVNAAKAGAPIDPIALLDALDRAEHLAASTSINAACRNLQPDLADAFLLSISVVISDLIEAVIGSPTPVNLTVLQDVVAAGIRSGVLSANAAPGSNADNLSIQLQAEFESRLQVALGPPVLTDDVQQIMLTALTMGWTSTAQKAAAAL